MARHVLVALAVLCAAGPPARGVELIAGWGSELAGDSNVFRTSDDEEADAIFRAGPVLRVREPRGDLVYEAKFETRYEAFTTIDDINDFEYFADGDLTWNISPRTQVAVSDVFASTSNVGTFFDVVGVDQSSVLIAERRRITANRGQASLSHRLGPLWQMTAQIENRLWEYENPARSDATAWSGTLQLTRSITPRLLLGIGATGQRQDFQGVDVPDFGTTPDNGTTFFQGFGLFTYQVTRTFTVSASAGPAWASPDDVDEAFAVSPVFRDPATGVRPLLRDAAGNPTGFLAPFPTNIPFNQAIQTDFVGEQADPSLTYFARVSLEKRWRLWRARATYQRSASSASGSGTSTILDSVEADVDWTPTEKWRISLSAIYTRQQAVSQGRQRVPVFEPLPAVLVASAGATGVYEPGVCPPGPPSSCFQANFSQVVAVTSGDEIDDAIDYTTSRVSLRAQRRITRRLRLLASASWLRQQNEGALTTQEDPRDVYLVSLGFTWEFEPIRL